MSPLVEFSIRSAVFMAVFLMVGYFLFQHIERIKHLHGEPENKDNYISVLKHFFMRRFNK